MRISQARNLSGPVTLRDSLDDEEDAFAHGQWHGVQALRPGVERDIDACIAWPPFEGGYRVDQHLRIPDVRFALGWIRGESGFVENHGESAIEHFTEPKRLGWRSNSDVIAPLLDLSSCAPSCNTWAVKVFCIGAGAIAEYLASNWLVGPGGVRSRVARGAQPERVGHQEQTASSS